MVLPLLAALAGMGGSIGAALIGAEEQDSANQWNWATNERNIRAQEEQQRKARAFADMLRAEEKLGSTDATGNRTHFVEGQGWVTDLAPRAQQLLDYFYNQELPERQRQFLRGAHASRENMDVAGALLDEFRRVAMENPADVEALLYSVANRGITESINDATEAAMRSSMRAGSSNAGDILASLAKESIEARQNAAVDAKLRAPEITQQRFAQKRGQVADLYNMFLRNASGDIGSSYDPQVDVTRSNALMQAFAGMSKQGDQYAMNTRMLPAPQRPQIEPNMAWANAVGAIGSAVSGGLDSMGSYMDRSGRNSDLLRYLSLNGQTNMGDGGIFGNITQRTRMGMGGGVF